MLKAAVGERDKGDMIYIDGLIENSKQ